MWLNFPNPVAVVDGKEVEAKKVKQAIYEARQQEIQSTAFEEICKGNLSRTDGTTRKLNWSICVAFFLEECPNAYHRWSTRA